MAEFNRRVQAITLRNILSVGDEPVRIELGRSITLLYGENGAGKSALRRTTAWFEQMVREGFSPDMARQTPAEPLQLPLWMRHGHADSATSELSIEFAHESPDNSFFSVSRVSLAWMPAAREPTSSHGEESTAGSNATRQAHSESESTQRHAPANDSLPSGRHAIRAIFNWPDGSERSWHVRPIPVAQTESPGSATTWVYEVDELPGIGLRPDAACFDPFLANKGWLDSQWAAPPPGLEAKYDESVGTLCSILGCLFLSGRTVVRGSANQETKRSFSASDGNEPEWHRNRSKSLRVWASHLWRNILPESPRLSYREYLAETPDPRFSLGDGVSIPEEFLSSGERHVFEIIDEAVKSADDLLDERKLIFLEEPEIHLHSLTQGRLVRELLTRGDPPDYTADAPWSYVREAAVPFFGFATVVLETHSDAILKAVLAEVAGGHLKPDDVRIYVVHKDEKGATVVCDVVFTELGEILVWPGAFPDGFAGVEA